MGSLSRFSIVLVAVVGLTGCASLSIPDFGGEEGESDHPDYENFDPAGYEASPPEEADREHDVPARLMAGRVDAPGATTEPRETEPRESAPEPPPTSTTNEVDGFRIHVYSSPDRSSSERVRNDAIAWWEGAFGESPSSRINYHQPYYRVQLGAFATEAEAQSALERVRRKYSDAFTVPDRVQIRR